MAICPRERKRLDSLKSDNHIGFNNLQEYETKQLLKEYMNKQQVETKQDQSDPAKLGTILNKVDKMNKYNIRE